MKDSHTMMRFEEIPEEIVYVILSHLSQEDIKNFRLVCKEWRQLSYAFCLFKRAVVVIKNYPDLITSYTAQSEFFKDFKPVHMILLIKNKDMAWRFDKEKARQFWLNQGDKLRSLIVSIAGYHFEILLEILMHCNNLKHLQVITDFTPKGFRKNSLDLSLFEQIMFEKLSSLSVLGERQLIIPLLKHAVRTAPKLENIALVCNSPNYEHKLHTPTGTIDLSQSRFLKGILLYCSCIFNEFIDKITLTVGQQLEKLVIGNCCNFSDLKHIGQRCPGLKKLIIEDGTFTPSQFINAFQSLRKLTVIAICMSSITDEAIASLAAVQNLTHLCIAHCSNISNIGISKIFGKKVKPLIIELRFLCLSITDTLIVEIAPHLPNLKLINLSHCYCITMTSIVALTTHNQSIQCLSVAHCFRVDEIPVGLFDDDAILGNVLSRMCHLSKLIHLTVTGVEFFSNMCTLFLSSSSLKVLEVAEIPDRIQVLLLQMRCPSLKYINGISCQVGEYNPDPIIKSLRLNRLLNCSKSPFGSFANLR